MKIKQDGDWSVPGKVGFKIPQGWQHATEVHHKNPEGEWNKVLDFSPVLAFKAVCDYAYNTHDLHPCIYETFWEGDFVVQSGDYLEYEVLSTPGTDQVKVDIGLISPSGSLAYVGVLSNPEDGWSHGLLNYGTDGVWVVQKISMAAAVNHRAIDAFISTESDVVGPKEIYVRKVVITNGGQVRVNLFTDHLHVPNHKVWQPQWGTLRNYQFISKQVLPSYNP